jgi:hypothetical protein
VAVDGQLEGVGQGAAVVRVYESVGGEATDGVGVESESLRVTRAGAGHRGVGSDFPHQVRRVVEEELRVRQRRFPRAPCVRQRLLLLHLHSREERG